MGRVLSRAIQPRRFGVELEFHFAGVSRYDNSLKAAKLLQTLPNGCRWNNVGTDGSGCEVRSPILVGATGLKRLQTVMNALVTAGGVANQMDGGHVHHDAPEFVRSKEMQELLVDSWKNNEKQIDTFVASRRRRSQACSKWTNDDIRYFKEAVVAHRYPGPRGALNLHSLPEHGTVEIRLHEGTLNYEEMESWIIFGQRFLNYVVRHARVLDTVAGQKDLLKALAVPPTATKRLLAKAEREARPARV